MRILRGPLAADLTKDRERLEAKVADKLGDYLFETFETTYKGIATGICQMFRDRANRWHGDRFGPFLRSQTTYDMWKHTNHPSTLQGLEDICRSIVRTHDKSVLYSLSDLIRLAGEWIEVCHEDKMAFMEDGFEEKEKLKPKPTFQKTPLCPYCKSRSFQVVVTDATVSTFLCRGPNHANAVNRLLNKTVKTEPDRKLIELLLDRHGRFRMENPFPGHRDRDVQTDDESRQTRESRGSSDHLLSIARDYVALRGIEKWKLEKDSVIRAIDETYGLPKGGDVSGTTTDSMYIVQSIHGKLDPQSQVENADIWALQLIPVATLVHAGHHTVVECAYPLTRWKTIDYKIGFYSSLTPDDANMDVRSISRVDELYRELRPFDHEVPHILTWKDKSPETGGVIKLGVEFDKGESSSLRASTKFFDVMSAYSMCSAGPFPSTKDVFNKLNLYHKELSMDLVDTMSKDDDWPVQLLGRKVCNWARSKNLYDRVGVRPN